MKKNFTDVYVRKLSQKNWYFKIEFSKNFSDSEFRDEVLTEFGSSGVSFMKFSKAVEKLGAKNVSYNQLRGETLPMKKHIEKSRA